MGARFCPARLALAKVLQLQVDRAGMCMPYMAIIQRFKPHQLLLVSKHPSAPACADHLASAAAAAQPPHRHGSLLCKCLRHAAAAVAAAPPLQLTPVDIFDYFLSPTRPILVIFRYPCRFQHDTCSAQHVL